MRTAVLTPVRPLEKTIRVEIGRCPVYYLAEKPAPCAAHTWLVKITGAYRRPPQTDSSATRREHLESHGQRRPSRSARAVSRA